MRCTYCRSDLSSYEPVSVQKQVNPDPVDVGVFCNYACLTAFIDDERLTAGEACAWTPDEAGRQR